MGERYYSNPRPEMLAFVPANAQRILEIGCGEGSFGAQLRQERGCEVWGIELVPEVAENAKVNLDTVLSGSVEDNLKNLPDGAFDVVICNDVLEHLAWPDEMLKALACKLSPTGVVVASIPNLRHLRSFLRLAAHGQFPYESEGIFDRTHLRFFTRTSMVEMFSRAGYHLVSQVGINGSQGGRRWYRRILFSLVFLAVPDTRFLQYACVAKPRR